MPGRTFQTKTPFSAASAARRLRSVMEVECRFETVW
jgi:hypothetical protein